MIKTGSRIEDRGAGSGELRTGSDKTVETTTATLGSQVGGGARHAVGLTRFLVLDSQFQTGFSLISAIFLLVVIAALATFAVTLFTTQQQSAALDVLGSRAYQAARAGIEWGAYQVLPNSAVPNGFAAHCRAGATSQVVAPLPNTLAGFNVNVQCSATAHSESEATISVYQLKSTAMQGKVTTSSYVERQMTAIIAQ